MITRKVILPKNCAIGFGIPADRQSFLRALNNPNADYVRKYHGGIDQYQRHFLNELDRFLAVIARWDVYVEPLLNVESFSALLDGSFDVVTLFSHWSGESVEFSTGLVESNAIVNAVPPAFSGFIDLCICHPLSLVDQLNSKRQNCHIKSEPISVPPIEWLYIYRLLFSELAKGTTPYLDAWVNILKAVQQVRNNGRT